MQSLVWFIIIQRMRLFYTKYAVIGSSVITFMDGVQLFEGPLVIGLLDGLQLFKGCISLITTMRSLVPLLSVSWLWTYRTVYYHSSDAFLYIFNYPKDTLLLLAQ